MTKFNAESICDPKENLCLNHKDHLFWDLFHPTHQLPVKILEGASTTGAFIIT